MTKQRAYRNLATGSLLFAAVTVAHAAEPLPASLSVRLEVQRPSVNASEVAIIVYTLRNDSSEDVWVLYRQTPMRGILGDLFEIRRDGQPVDYIGLIVEWATPEQSDFICIPAGGEVSASVNLATSYDMSRRGEYSVSSRRPYEGLLVKNASGAVMFARLNSDTATFWVDRDEATQQRPMSRSEEEGGKSPLASTPSFVGCSTSRQNQLKAVLAGAQTISEQANSRLTASTPMTGFADKDYRTWFGCYDSKRYAKVKSNFAAIFSALATQSFQFYCDDGSDATCKEHRGAFAHAERRVPNHVHLCTRFWTLPFINTTDSKVTALVHETSHFEAVADTLDITDPTTPSLCQLVAKSPDNRDLPINNACGYQYFAGSLPSTRSGNVAPKITSADGPLTLIGDGTWVPAIMSFTNDDCDPIVLIESRIVEAPPGNWTTSNWENPTLFEGTWQEGEFRFWYHCYWSSHGTVGPIVDEIVLVDAAGLRSQPITIDSYCTGIH
jgi:peptidyl-Lys metalloendopeptidase